MPPSTLDNPPPSTHCHCHGHPDKLLLLDLSVFLCIWFSIWGYFIAVPHSNETLAAIEKNIQFVRYYDAQIKTMMTFSKPCLRSPGLSTSRHTPVHTSITLNPHPPTLSLSTHNDDALPHMRRRCLTMCAFAHLLCSPLSPPPPRARAVLVYYYQQIYARAKDIFFAIPFPDAAFLVVGTCVGDDSEANDRGVTMRRSIFRHVLASTFICYHACSIKFKETCTSGKGGVLVKMGCIPRFTFPRGVTGKGVTGGHIPLSLSHTHTHTHIIPVSTNTTAQTYYEYIV